MSVGHRFRLRGEICMGFGSVLSCVQVQLLNFDFKLTRDSEHRLAAFLLLIFVHVRRSPIQTVRILETE